MKLRKFWMDTDILDQALDNCDLGDWYTARVRQYPHMSYKHLYTKVREVNPELDAAYKACEEAVEFAYLHLESMDNYSLVHGARYELNKALTLLRKAKDANT